MCARRPAGVKPNRDTRRPGKNRPLELLCLARVLLQRPRLILMDEASVPRTCCHMRISPPLLNLKGVTALHALALLDEASL